MSHSPFLYSYYVRVEEHVDAMRIHAGKNALTKLMSTLDRI